MPRNWGERLSAAGFIVFAAYAGYMALDFPAGGGSFPLFAAGGSILLAAMILLDSFVRPEPVREKSARAPLTYHRL